MKIRKEQITHTKKKIAVEMKQIKLPFHSLEYYFYTNLRAIVASILGLSIPVVASLIRALPF